MNPTATTEQDQQQEINLRLLLQEMIQKGASDLHITAGTRPKIHIDGDLHDTQVDVVLTPKDTLSIAYSILTENQKKRFETEDELDFSFGVQNLSRFRGNCFKQRGCVAMAIRQIPYKIVTIAELGLPAVVAEFADRPRGLVLVTGPTGSGKSTTLAALVDKINKERRGHIITIEDPIEFIHRHQKCMVNQREVGADTKSFSAALKYALRQDPDTILIGEMRDLETIGAALTIAETGHLVLATLHTNSAAESINRIIDAFPAHQQAQVRAQLAFVLEGVITQTLLPKVFSELFVNMVAAGEAGGILDTILLRLATFLEKNDALVRKIKGAMIYPAVIFSVAGMAIVILLIFVIPTFQTMFESAGIPLPLPTRIVIGMSQFLQAFWWALLIGIVASVFAIRQAYSTDGGRLFIDKLMLALPILGDLQRKAAVARFTRTLGTLVSSGVSILEGLEITAKTAGNRVIHDAVMSSRASIAGGETIAGPLKESGVFPPMVVQMINVGEQTGGLDTMLTKIADFYDDEVDAAVEALLAAMEPIMIVVLGVVVGGMIVAMYLPIFDMINAVG